MKIITGHCVLYTWQKYTFPNENKIVFIEF